MTDQNLWLWATGGTTWPSTGMPPLVYTPFKTFATLLDAIRYCWQTGSGTAVQR